MRALLSRLIKKKAEKSPPSKSAPSSSNKEKGFSKKENPQFCNLESLSDEEEESEVVDILIKMGDHLKITKINSSLQGQYRTLCHINHMLCQNPIAIPNVQKFLLTKSGEKVDYQARMGLQKNSSHSRQALQYYTLFSNGLIFQFYSVRALLWKVSLQYLPPSKNKWVSTMEGTLINYHDHLVQHILEIVAKKKGRKQLHHESLQKNHEQKRRKASDHPLNLLKQSKWKTFFQDKQLWNMIEKDTMRTKPNCKFFREEFEIEIQQIKEYGLLKGQVHLSMNRQKTYYYDCLTRIIYIFLRTNPQFSYCQGMNELAALVFYSFANKNSEYFRRVAESDAFYCFQKITRNIYRLPIPGFLNGERYSHRFEDLLKKVDMRLYEQLSAKPGVLNAIRILSIKWFNSLFLNEYEIDGTLILWDGFISTICADEEREPFISFHNLVMSLGLAMIHLNRKALSEGENPMLIFAKVPHSPETLLEKAISLYKIFRQFFQ